MGLWRECYVCGMAAKSTKAGNGQAKEVAREPAKTPGDILRRSFMEPLGLTAYRVAKDIDVAQITLSQILHGKRGISPSMAVRLGRYFDVPPQFWLAMQAEHDLSKIAAGAPELDVQKSVKMGDRRFRVLPATPQPGSSANPARAMVIKFQRPRPEPMGEKATIRPGSDSR